MGDCPRRILPALEVLARRVVERRGPACRPEILARDLLAGFYEVCLQAGLDGVLQDVEQGLAITIVDDSGLSEEPRLCAALAARIGTRAEFDPGGPRAAMPAQLATCLLASLSLTLSDPPARAITLDHDVRAELTERLTRVVEAALSAPAIRAAIVSTAREYCDPRHLDALEEVVPQLDERGSSWPARASMRLDARQAIQRLLGDARADVVERAADAAIESAKEALAAREPAAAGRIDLPITFRLTPREVALLRLRAHAVSRPEVVVPALLDTLSELAELVWRPPTPAPRTYTPGETFAVGDVIEHPAFGRGTVYAATDRVVDVEFAEGWRTLVHARRR